MTKSYYYILLLTLSSAIYSQSIRFQVKDSLTKENIEFVSVNLLNGTGFFTNEDGKVVADLSGINTIELSHVSYETKKILAANIGSIIYLQRRINLLNEIQIVGKNSKKYFTYKTKKTKEPSLFGFGTYGAQVAMLIQVDSEKDCFLDEVLIPVKVDELWKKINNIKVDPLSIVRITFNKNVEENPSDSLLQIAKYIFVDKKMLRNEIINFKLPTRIRIPKSGLFCVITMIGKADVNGNLQFEIPTRKEEIDGKIVSFAKYLPIQIPINELHDDSADLSRNFFGTDLHFYKVKPAIAVPRALSKEETVDYLKYESAKMPNYKVGIGYKYFYYE